jgi:DNA mismatch repair protein PMS2
MKPLKSCLFSQKIVQIKTLGQCPRSSITALWGPKALDNIVDLEVAFEFERERYTLKRVQASERDSMDDNPISVQVKGLISKFAVGYGRTGTDRQFFYVNGRPCNLPAVSEFTGVISFTGLGCV